MRHRVKSSKLNRTKGHLVALRRNMAGSLIQHGQIRTTLPKARHVQRFVEKLITLARKDTLHARRMIISRLQDRFMVEGHDPREDKSVKLNKYDKVVDGPSVVKKLFEEVAPKYADRDGGYTRIIHSGKRRIGDAAEIVVLQLVDPNEPAKKKPTNVSPRRRRARARYALYDKKAPKKETRADVEDEAAEDQADETEAADESAEEEESK